MPAIINLLGQRFGRLRVVDFAEVRDVGKSKSRRAFWHCVCDCGTNTVVCAGNLRSGGSTNCGCWKIGRAMNLVHGEARSRVNLRTSEWLAWSSMIQRCENANHKAYKRYGGRGIKVCAQWRESYPAFLADLGRKPSPQYSLDRIDNDGHYEPGNVRWATAKQQANNRSRTAAERVTNNAAQI